MKRVVLTGSRRLRMPQARATAPADPQERLEVTVLVRRRLAEALRSRVREISLRRDGAAPMSRTEFSDQHGADPADLEAVRQFAEQHGLRVVMAHPARRTIILSGTVAQFEEAFSVRLRHFAHPGGTYRGRIGTVSIPASLEGVIEAVLGLDNRPQASPHFRVAARARAAGTRAKSRGSRPSVSFTPLQVASLYGFPAGSGKGECIALIELGGGYRPEDLASYFNGLGTPAPTVTAVSVDHARNAPTGDANGPDGEVMLDIEVAGAIAPSARIVVYFATNTDAGFLNAITTAIHDTVNQPSVVSISWGSAEASWTAQSMAAMDEAFQAAATLGVTICVASGDNGSSDGQPSGDHVDFPASSPFALACGGTRLQSSGRAIGSETVWNDGAAGGASGGGVSGFFALPVWQKGLKVSRRGNSAGALRRRGVPDVSGDADPQTGYQVRVDGSGMVIGGTSAVAPLWAGLIARLNQAAGRPVGYLNPVIYGHASALRDITSGNNGDFSAAPGWDACTGLGSPDGAALASLLGAQ